MPLSQQRLNDIIRKLRSVLVSQHPNWENYVNAIARRAAEDLVVKPPPAVPRDFDIRALTAPQMANLKQRIRALLTNQADKDALDEVLP